MVKTRKSKPKISYEIAYSNAAYKQALRRLIIKYNLSVYQAAMKLDIDVTKAEYLLYAKKPTKAQIDHAFEIYNKGFAFNLACAASGVSPNEFKIAMRKKKSEQLTPNKK